ncbi:3-phytase [Paraliobacillus quinghaiensis]|uniref:3-phytase n=1 Tax=Paraliobacillus quinghaiensis TaxID=470815 RepID=A0A917THE5_9BACI|nr:esterase-like activity of phytase family protein [Paraliobacillus quinghaiensis]GGM23570.1 3-phytase [Paraliobacillus quinghaiensis]
MKLRLFKFGMIAVVLLLSRFISKKGKVVKKQSNHENLINKITESHTVSQLAFIGEKRIPNDTTLGEIAVGGFSGIDYNPQTEKWILISDDSSGRATACFYTAELEYDSHNFYEVTFKDVTHLKQTDGTTYPSSTQHDKKQTGIVPDFESIRFDPNTNTIWYTSEGDRKIGLMSFIRHAKLNGQYLSDLKLPDQFKIGSKPNVGFRHNLAFEGSTFTPNGDFYYTTTEAPIYQDGDVSSTTHGSYIRIIKYDRQGEILAEYAYPVSEIPAKPDKDKAAGNGVSEILAINNHELLILERAGVQMKDDSYFNYVSIYKGDTSSASNISQLNSLKSGSFTPICKKLVLDLNTLDLPTIDNIEGMSWGPKLKNGHESLVLVSDNNFNSSEVTQFLAFEVIPK